MIKVKSQSSFSIFSHEYESTRTAISTAIDEKSSKQMFAVTNSISKSNGQKSNRITAFPTDTYS
jgi:hypothetical protein